MSDLSGRAVRWAAKTRKRQRAMGRVLEAAAPILPRKPPPREPVFLIGAPRSGTTLVFEILNRAASLSSLDHESQLLWDMFHRIEESGWSSHALGPEVITGRERRVLSWAIDRVARDERYLDKLPRNCLRVPYLHGLFPDAWFVFIRRDGRATVSSMITGWQASGKFGQGTRLPVPLSIEGYSGAEWKFVLPEGWREYATGKTLVEVCAFQWSAANDAVLDARDAIGTERWVDVRYETLIVSPRETVAGLLEALGLPPDERALAFASEIDRHVTRTAVTPPRLDKWRDEHPEEIERLLPVIAPTMRRLGYDVEMS